MATITYMPWKEIVLHEVNEMPIQQFLEWVVSQVEAQKQGGTPLVRWVDGIAFAFGEFADTPEVVAEKLNGKIHWGIVHFTKTSYQLEKKVTWNGRDHVVRLVKAENNPDMVNVAKFLQDFKPSPTNPTINTTTAPDG